MTPQVAAYNPTAPMPRPYVQFERRSKEIRDRDGVSKFVDQDIVTLIAPGSRDSTELEVSDWLSKLRDHARNNRVPGSWPKEYADAYEQWKDTQEQPTHGTSVRNWPALSQAQRDNCLKANLLTVEDLASATDEAIQRLGMGGVSLKKLANFWLEEKGGSAATASQLASLTLRSEEQQAQIAELMETNRQLVARLEAKQKE